MQSKPNEKIQTQETVILYSSYSLLFVHFIYQSTKNQKRINKTNSKIFVCLYAFSVAANHKMDNDVCRPVNSK